MRRNKHQRTQVGGRRNLLPLFPELETTVVLPLLIARLRFKPHHQHPLFISKCLLHLHVRPHPLAHLLNLPLPLPHHLFYQEEVMLQPSLRHRHLLHRLLVQYRQHVRLQRRRHVRLPHHQVDLKFRLHHHGLRAQRPQHLHRRHRARLLVLRQLLLVHPRHRRHHHHRHHLLVVLLRKFP